MGTKVALAVAAGLLFGLGLCGAAEHAPAAPKDAENRIIELPDNSMITIAPGTKMTVHQVTTEHGKRVRLETPGITIDSVRLRVKWKDNITEVRVGRDALDVRTSQVGKP